MKQSVNRREKPDQSDAKFKTKVGTSRLKQSDTEINQV